MQINSNITEEIWFQETKRATNARVVASLLAPYIRNYFSSIISSDHTISAVPKQGWNSIVLFVNGPDGFQEYVIRLYKSLSHISHNHFEKEVAMLRMVASLNLSQQLIDNPVGTIRIPNRDASVITYDYLVTEALPGITGHALPQQRIKILQQLGEQLRIIHSVQVSGFGTTYSPHDKNFSSPTFEHSLLSKLDALKADSLVLSEQPFINSKIIDWLETRLFRLINEAKALKPFLYHQDLLGNLGNVIVDQNGSVKGVIDWEYAGGGLAFEQDLASFQYVMNRDGVDQGVAKAHIHAVLDGYGLSHNEYLARAESIETLVLLYSLEALAKLEAAKRAKRLGEEPWREVFARRARFHCVKGFRREGMQL